MKRRKLSAREVAVCFRVRDQLERIRSPEKFREPQESAPTIEEFLAMDRTISIMEVERVETELDRIRDRIRGKYWESQLYKKVGT